MERLQEGRCEGNVQGRGRSGINVVEWLQWSIVVLQWVYWFGLAGYGRFLVVGLELRGRCADGQWSGLM